MKKIGKVLLAFLLVIGIGFTGFTLGKNSSSNNQLISEENQKHMAQMEAMKELIDENYLFDYDEKQLYDGSLKGMFENLGDPYTAYYTKDEFEKLMEEVNGKYAGIGVAVQASDEAISRLFLFLINLLHKKLVLRLEIILQRLMIFLILLSNWKRLFLKSGVMLVIR